MRRMACALVLALAGLGFTQEQGPRLAGTPPTPGQAEQSSEGLTTPEVQQFIHDGLSSESALAGASVRNGMDAPGQSGIKCARVESARPTTTKLGLVPRQHSSGGKPTLLGISKRGDRYVRTLLIHGARSVIEAAERRTKPVVLEASTQQRSWLQGLVVRRNRNVAAVALANKNARVIWALLAQDRHYQAGHCAVAA